MASFLLNGAYLSWAFRERRKFVGVAGQFTPNVLRAVGNGGGGRSPLAPGRSVNPIWIESGGRFCPSKFSDLPLALVLASFMSNFQALELPGWTQFIPSNGPNGSYSAPLWMKAFYFLAANPNSKAREIWLGISIHWKDKLTSR